MQLLCFIILLSTLLGLADCFKLSKSSITFPDQYIQKKIASIFLFTSGALFGLTPSYSQADSKLRNLSPIEIARIVTDDIVIHQALATADFSRDIYDEACTFQDEISTYKIDEYVKGTKALFDSTQSHVNLVEPVVASEDSIELKFSEVLAFRIPFSPKVSLTGKVRLVRGKDGLIISSREYWDDSVSKVLSTARF